MSEKMEVLPLASKHKNQWTNLIRQYNQFYKVVRTGAEFDVAWDRILRNDGVNGVGAFDGGTMVGIAHFLFHTTTWDPKVCYLQDLFVATEFRRQGIAKMLIEHIADLARSGGASKFYWLTQDDNRPARGLYDQLAKFDGFIRYDCPIAMNLITEAGGA